MVEYKSTRGALEATEGAGNRVLQAVLGKGVICRTKGDSVLMAPLVMVSEEQIDRMLQVLAESIQEVAEAA